MNEEHLTEISGRVAELMGSMLARLDGGMNMVFLGLKEAKERVDGWAAAESISFINGGKIEMIKAYREEAAKMADMRLWQCSTQQLVNAVHKIEPGDVDKEALIAIITNAGRRDSHWLKMMFSTE